MDHFSAGICRLHRCQPMCAQWIHSEYLGVKKWVTVNHKCKAANLVGPFCTYRSCKQTLFAYMDAVVCGIFLHTTLPCFIQILRSRGSARAFLRVSKPLRSWSVYELAKMGTNKNGILFPSSSIFLMSPASSTLPHLLLVRLEYKKCQWRMPFETRTQLSRPYESIQHVFMAHVEKKSGNFLAMRVRVNKLAWLRLLNCWVAQCPAWANRKKDGGGSNRQAFTSTSIQIYTQFPCCSLQFPR